VSETSLLDLDDTDDEELLADIMRSSYGAVLNVEQYMLGRKITQDLYNIKLARLDASNVLQLKREELQKKLYLVKQVRPPGLSDPVDAELIDAPSTASFEHPLPVKWWLMFNQPGNSCQKFCEIHFVNDKDEFFITSVVTSPGISNLYIHVRRAGQPYPVLSNLHKFHSVVFLLRIGIEPKVLIRDISHNQYRACVSHTDGTSAWIDGVPAVITTRNTKKATYDRVELKLLNRHWRAPVILSHACELTYIDSPLCTRPVKIFFLDDSSCQVTIDEATFQAVFDVRAESVGETDAHVCASGSGGGEHVIKGTVVQPSTGLYTDSLPSKTGDDSLLVVNSGTLAERYQRFTNTQYRAASESVWETLASFSHLTNIELAVAHAGVYRHGGEGDINQGTRRMKHTHDSIMAQCLEFFFLLGFRQHVDAHLSMLKVLSLSLSLKTKKEVPSGKLRNAVLRWLEDSFEIESFNELFVVYRQGAYVKMALKDLYREGVLAIMDRHGGWDVPFGDDIEREKMALRSFITTVNFFRIENNFRFVNRFDRSVDLRPEAKRAMLELMLVALADIEELDINLIVVEDNGDVEMVNFKGVEESSEEEEEDTRKKEEVFLVFGSDEFFVICNRAHVDGKFFQ
jgi:hypothetical protein